jgi:dipeptidyl aminopeptidase/acylaminoacyl peptidase
LKRSDSIFWTTRIPFAGLLIFLWGWLLLIFAVWYGAQESPRPEFAYMSDQDGDWDIFTMDMDRRIGLRLTIDSPTETLSSSSSISAPNVSPSGVLYNVIDDRYPAWSPDGQWLVYHSSIYGNWDLYIMDATGNQIRQLTNDPADEAMPVWSPDGTRIAFHSTRGGNWDIYVLTVTTGGIQQMTFFAGEDTFASWSPDGTQIVYVSDRDGDQEIYVRRALGTTPPEALEDYSLRQLTDNDVSDWSPTWSPDGQYIAYVTEDITGNYEVTLMNPETGAPMVTLDGGNNSLGQIANEWNPAWVQTENGLSLMFVSDLTGVESIYLIDVSQCLDAMSAETTDGQARVTTCRYGGANLITSGGIGADGFAENQWAPDWRPIP